MAISNPTIKTKIVALIDQTKVMPVDTAEDAFAQGLANIIQAAIVSATITIPSGIPVATTGTAVAQTGTTTAPSVTGTLS